MWRVKLKHILHKTFPKTFTDTNKQKFKTPVVNITKSCTRLNILFQLDLIQYTACFLHFTESILFFRCCKYLAYSSLIVSNTRMLPTEQPLSCCWYWTWYFYNAPSYKHMNQTLHFGLSYVRSSKSSSSSYPQTQRNNKQNKKTILNENIGKFITVHTIKIAIHEICLFRNKLASQIQKAVQYKIVVKSLEEAGLV